MRTRQPGFTLTEVLVTAFIAAVLGAILFACLGPVREAARSRVCASNLRQIGQGMRLYIDDNEGSAPAKGQPSQYWDLGIPPTRQVGLFVANYIKNRHVLFCPDYHGSTPPSRKLMTYSWVPDGDPDHPQDSRFPRLVEALGEEVPLLTCDQHNAFWDRGSEPRWSLKHVIILRYSGRVQSRNVTVRQPLVTW